MRMLALYLLIFAGLWMLASAASRKSELARMARECGEPVPSEYVAAEYSAQSHLQ